MRTLLVGRPSEIFLEADGLQDLDVCADLGSAVQRLKDDPYDVVALQLRGLDPRLGGLIRQIRSQTRARLILLIRIYEEPVAIQYTDRLGPEYLDDYLIYPLTLEAFKRGLGAGQDRAVHTDQQASRTGPDLDRRIRILERLATEDDLTGLKNRRYVWEFARQIIARATLEPLRVTLLLFDIDDFKGYNDAHGHATGDRILKEIGQLIRQCCRPHDVVGRLGGDEFAVIVWDDPARLGGGRTPERRSGSVHPTQVLAIAQRFTEALSRSNWSSLGPRGKGTLTVSGGLASFPQDGKTVEELFEKADTALMEAKRSGRNRILVVGQAQGPVQ